MGAQEDFLAQTFQFVLLARCGVSVSLVYSFTISLLTQPIVLSVFFQQLRALVLSRICPSVFDILPHLLSRSFIGDIDKVDLVKLGKPHRSPENGDCFSYSP